MKIGIYSDAHFSKYSSNLISSAGKYSKRLSSLLDSFKWMYEEFNKLGVEVVINCGDLTSSDSLSSDVSSALAEALSNVYCTIVTVHAICAGRRSLMRFPAAARR